MFDFHVSLAAEDLGADLLQSLIADAARTDPSIDPDLFDTIAINRIELP